MLNWKCHYATACFLMRASPYCWTKLNLFGYLNKNVDRNIVHFECKKGYRNYLQFSCKEQFIEFNNFSNPMTIKFLITFTFIKWQFSTLLWHFHDILFETKEIFCICFEKCFHESIFIFLLVICPSKMYSNQIKLDENWVYDP